MPRCFGENPKVVASLTFQTPKGFLIEWKSFIHFNTAYSKFKIWHKVTLMKLNFLWRSCMQFSFQFSYIFRTFVFVLKNCVSDWHAWIWTFFIFSKNILQKVVSVTWSNVLKYAVLKSPLRIAGSGNLIKAISLCKLFQLHSSWTTNSEAVISWASDSDWSTLCAPITTRADMAPSAQWAAVITHSSEINDALQNQSPSELWTKMATSQGNWWGFASSPPTIFSELFSLPQSAKKIIRNVVKSVQESFSKIQITLFYSLSKIIKKFQLLRFWIYYLYSKKPEFLQNRTLEKNVL